jgi:hypothetical protein
MRTIHAVWKNGVFKPDGSIDLADGARVEMQVTAIASSMAAPKRASPLPLPDPPFESEACSAPFDLPMPADGETVKTCTKGILRPEAHDMTE